MPGRGEPFHRLLALPGRLMRVLGPDVQILRLPVFHRGHHHAVGRPVAGELVGDEHPRHVPQSQYYCDQAARTPHALPSWARSYRKDDARMAQHASREAAYVRLACDIVASLSERQAFAIYSRVTGQTSGTVLESILR